MFSSLMVLQALNRDGIGNWNGDDRPSAEGKLIGDYIIRNIWSCFRPRLLGEKL